jgi:hypothetical protein
MSKRFAQVVIVAEDERSANLLRRYVQRALHLDNRRIRQLISPSARGDAKRWVLSRYPIEVKAMRGKHPKVGLVVHLDADNESVAKRAAQLAAALKSSEQDARAAKEWICHAIPKRHTETWLCALSGVAVDEERDCKLQPLLPDYDRVLQQAALALFDLTRPNARLPTLPSLVTAIPEFQRLET